MFGLGKHQRLVVCLLLLVLPAVCSPAALSAQSNVAGSAPASAPVNPAFLKYQAELGSNPPALQTSTGHWLGHVPSPVDRSYLKDLPVSLDAETLPAAYDLRKKRKVSPVRNQGQCGSCWIFGAVASAESTLLPVELADFSEGAINEFHGFDSLPCVGGNGDKATAILARWNSLVPESEFPYPYLNMAEKYPKTNWTKADAYHVQDVLWIPWNHDKVKQAVMSRGAVDVDIHMDDSKYYNETNFAYYCPDVLSTNHDVAIVGWDDNYPKANFLTTPPGDGAFIIKNSWGSWGDGGYFYVSYYDKSLGGDGGVYQFIVSNPSKNYDWVYAYDALGHTESIGYGDPTGWMANVFLANPEASNLNAAAFYALAPGTLYEISVYDGVTEGKPTSGKLVKTVSGTLTYAGYRTVQFPKPVKVKGPLFSIVAKLTTPGSTFPLALEEPKKDHSSRARGRNNQSFFSKDGTEWTEHCATVESGKIECDKDKYPYAYVNGCLKAFSEAAGK